MALPCTVLLHGGNSRRAGDELLVTHRFKEELIDKVFKQQAWVELGLRQAEAVSLELCLIKGL